MNSAATAKPTWLASSACFTLIKGWGKGFTATALLLGSGVVSALDVAGEVSVYESAAGVEERCVQIAPMPGVQLGDSDRKIISAYCRIDFSSVALCPKLWSTSPGTIVYELKGEATPTSLSSFEKEHCPGGHHAKNEAKRKLATYKITVNGRETSATFSPSSWVYFHFSRFLEAGVFVPPSVYREFDRSLHLARVSQPGLDISSPRRGLRMLSAGWQHLVDVEGGAMTGFVANEALTPDGLKVFGVLLDNKGDRYGAEINGTRESGWGSGQNYDFQHTAPFLALRSEGSVSQAIEAGLHDAKKDPAMAAALVSVPSAAQMIFWMNDLLEITLMDYILGQQDRIGNIDYLWTWNWIQDGELKQARAKSKEAPKKLQPFSPVRLKRSAINDNDAGVRNGYANYAKKTGMLDGLKHYNPRLYENLARLNEGLSGKGPLYQWLRTSAGLSERQADGISSRAAEAWARLSEDCQNGSLKLDLLPELAFDWAFPTPEISCAPE